jgi:hypothetical protein
MAEANPKNRGRQVGWRIPEDIRDRMNLQAIHKKTDAELLVAKWLRERLELEEAAPKSRK